MRAFVLSGGGNLGATQVGAVLALYERGIAPDLLVGTSAGAINAAYLAGDPGLEGARRLAKIWSSVRTRDVFRFPVKPWHLLSHLRGDALYHSDGLRRVLERSLPYRHIEDARLRLRVVATDFETGREVAFHSGSVVDAVLASAALPGLFPPVRVDGRLYVDGGIADNVPISPAVGAGAREIYVIHVGFDCPAGARLRAVDVLWRSVGMLLNRTLAEDVRRFSNSARIVVLPSPCVPPTPIWNLSRSRELITEAHRMAGEYLDGKGIEKPAEVVPFLQPDDIGSRDGDGVMLRSLWRSIPSVTRLGLAIAAYGIFADFIHHVFAPGMHAGRGLRGAALVHEDRRCAVQRGRHGPEDADR